LTEPQPASAVTPRPSVLPVVVPVALAGAVVAVGAIWTLVTAPPSLGFWLGSAALLLAATVAEAFPVPLVGVSQGGISIAASFLVDAAVLSDWRAATILGLLSRLTLEIAGRRPPERLIYNSAVYALAAAAAGGVVALADDVESAGGLAASVCLGALAFYVVNLVLVAVVIARASPARIDRVLFEGARWTAVPFAIMASISLMLEVLWTRFPAFALALGGPLVAVALYQRSVHRSLEAMRLAMTDPLTNLGNHRAFDERLEELIEAGRPFALCLLDLDSFKQVNDRHGHQAGDAVLAGVAAHVAAAGDGYRLGGDELALLLTGDDPATAAQAVCDAVEASDFGVPSRTSVSIGYARFPADGTDDDRLIACADAALYHAKRLGKNRVSAYEVRLVEPDPGFASHGSSRIRALWQLTEIVDAVDADEISGSGHSQRVAELSVEIGRELGATEADVELIRLAARLHDLGKLTVPVEILAKSGALADVEWRAVREHPEIGRRILLSLGAGPVADWVLHQEARWDGVGHPAGLAGDEIPLASRIIYVANAFDAMTHDRPYRSATSVPLALREMERNAGTQFDPLVVAALVAVCRREDTPGVAAAG